MDYRTYRIWPLLLVLAALLDLTVISQTTPSYRHRGVLV